MTVRSSSTRLRPLLLLALAGMSACSSADDVDDVGQTPAQLRVTHAGAESSTANLDLYADNANVIVSGTARGETSDYVAIEPGTHDFTLTSRGTADARVQLDNVVLEPAQHYTLVVYGGVNASANVIEDDTAAASSGEINLRVVNAASGAGAIEAYTLNANGELSTSLGVVDLGNASESITIPSGAQRIGVDVDDDGAIDARFNVPSLSSSSNVSVYVSGVLDTNSPAASAESNLEVWAQIQGSARGNINVEAATTSLRVVNFGVLTSGAIDVQLDGLNSALAQDLSFGEASDYVRVQAGARAIDVLAAGTSVSLISRDAEDMRIHAGESWTVAIGGIASTGTLTTSFVLDDNAFIPSTRTRVRFIHMAQSVGEVDIVDETQSSLMLAGNLGFEEASAAYDLTLGKHTIGFDTDHDGSADLSYVVDLSAAMWGRVVNIYVIEDLTGHVRLAVVNANGSVRVLSALD